MTSGKNNVERYTVEYEGQQKRHTSSIRVAYADYLEGCTSGDRPEQLDQSDYEVCLFDLIFCLPFVCPGQSDIEAQRLYDMALDCAGSVGEQHAHGRLQSLADPAVSTSFPQRRCRSSSALPYGCTHCRHWILGRYKFTAMSLVLPDALSIHTGYQDVSWLLSTLLWSVLPYLHMRDIGFLVSLCIELGEDRRDDPLADIIRRHAPCRGPRLCAD